MTEIRPPTPEELEAMRKAWIPFNQTVLRDPNATETEKTTAANLLIQRSNNPGHASDSELNRSRSGR